MISEKLKIINESEVFVVGDLHGDLATLKNILKKVDVEKAVIVFLGDYADRGECGVEVYETILTLRRNFPSKVIMLKGNHECYLRVGDELIPTFSPCTFIDELKKKYRTGWKTKLDEFYSLWASLPLSVIVNRKFLLLHGGVSKRIKGIEDLKHPTAEIEEDILWSDPCEMNGEYPNPRGAGILFGPDVSKKVCDVLKVKTIIRSHQPHLPEVIKNGYAWHHNGRVLTISSTSVYGGISVYVRIYDGMIEICKV